MLEKYGLEAPEARAHFSSGAADTPDDLPNVTNTVVGSNRLLLDQAMAGLPGQPVAWYECNHVTGALALVEAGLGLIAALALLGGTFDLHGVARMHERPIGDLVDALDRILADHDLRERVSQIGEKIRERDGLRVAADVIERVGLEHRS